MTELTSTQRKRLRGLAHRLRPVVQIGASGVTGAVIQQINAALDQHELIKVRIELARPERDDAAAQVSQETNAGIAGTIGKVAVLFRPQPDPDKRRIDAGR